jgi:hypothetical protein
MASFADLPTTRTVLSDHTHLPESKGTAVKNFQKLQAEQQQAEKLAAQLRALGIDPDL